MSGPASLNNAQHIANALQARIYIDVATFPVRGRTSRR